MSKTLANQDNRQVEIKQWFDSIYTTKEFKYLRPIEAYEIFASILSPKKNTKHLDVACGLGLLLQTIQNKGPHVTGIDLSEVAIEKVKKLVPEASVQQGNAEQLPFEDEAFDSVTCIGSFERMLNRKQALKEQVRVGTKDAKYCFMVRNSEHFLWRVFQKPFGIYNKEGHQDAMNYEQWESLFAESGLKVIKVYPDQWPYMVIMKTIMPWRKWDFGRIRKFPFGIKNAYEFIFLLEKK